MTYKKTALVLGAGGFIGSHMVKRLRSEGYWVRGVDLKYPEFSKTEANEFVQGDLRDVHFVKRILEFKGGTMTLTVIHERYPYRYVDVGILENGFPDYRIQKYNENTGRYKDMYLCDNGDQLETAMEDFEYTKWLDPADVPCYNRTK